MAGIDKTYVSNYEDWKEITEYMKNTVFTCPNGIKLEGINYLYYPDIKQEEVEEWLSKRKSIPVMNTTCSMDYFLIKYCPIKVVQDRMNEVYNEDYIEAIKNSTSEYDTFVRPKGGKHVSIIEKPKQRYTYKWFNDYLNRYRKTGFRVTLRYPESLEGAYQEYNEDYDMFIFPFELGYQTESGGFTLTNCKSLKALIRKIIKWKLPIGTKVFVTGAYEEEQCTLLVKE